MHRRAGARSSLPARGIDERRAAARPSPATMAAFAVFALALQVQVVGYAFRLAGLSPLWVGVVLAVSLVGGLVDVPLFRLRAGDPAVVYVPVRASRMTVYLVPVERPPVTVAVNVGGGLVPSMVSAYLLAHTGRWLPAAGTVLVVALVVHATAIPVTDLGIATPVLLPAVIAAVVAAILAAGPDAAAVAYVGASLGTLAGADLANARWMRGVCGGVLSIGGAGTFDAIFISGVMGVLLATVLQL